MTINLINSSSAHFGAVRLVLFDPSNEKLISIGEDEGRLYIWNSDTLSPATGTTIEGKTENYSVRAAAFPDDFSFLFGGDDNTITEADWPNCNNYNICLESGSSIDFISVKWDTNTIAYSDQHMIRFYNKESSSYPEFPIENSITWLNFSRNAKFFAISCTDSTIIIWDASDFSEILHKKYDLGSSHPSWGPGDFLLIPISSSPGSVVIIEVSTLTEHQVQNPLEDISITTEVALSNNYMLAIADNSNQISFLQLNEDYSLTPFSTTKYSGSEISTLSFGSSNTNLIAAGDTDGTLFLFELIENKKQQTNDIDITNNVQSKNDNENDDEGSKKVETNSKSSSSLKTINDILKDRSDLVTLKQRTQPKKAKGKGKQQKLNLVKAPAPAKPKTIELKRKFISDNSSSSSSEDDLLNENNIDNDNESKKKKNFLNDSDDNFDDIENVEEIIDSKPKKSFLNDNDDDNDDFEAELENKKEELPNQINSNSKKLFLSDDDEDLEDTTIPNEQVNSLSSAKDNSFLNDDGIPGYDEIALPDDDDDIGDAIANEDNKHLEETEVAKESFTSKLQNPPNSLNYLDCSSSTRFTPGSFKQQNGKTDILCWNGEGSIVMYNPGPLDTDKYVEICPYGNSTFPIKRIDDAYEIILGTIDKYGYLLSTYNTVIYHRHNEVGPESEIIKSFPFLEDIQLAACGSSFFAVATARKFLHIFSSAGFEISVITLTGRIITMVGHENFLFVVSGKHHFDLFDVFNHSLVASGILPIHSPLRWAGFNQYDHSVLIEGGNHQLLALSYSEGIRWTPVVDLSSHFETTSNGILPLFIVEVYGNQVSGVYLDKEADELETNPFPENLKDIDFEPPTIESLLDSCVLSVINYQNSSDKEKEAKRFDKDLLVKFNTALSEEKLLLGYQIAKQMKTSLGLKLAIQICDQRGQSNLSERLMQLNDLKNEEEDYDDSDDFELDETTDEPEPFVRTENIQKEDEEDMIQKTNVFLDRFSSNKDTHKDNAENNEDDEDSDVQVNKKDTKTKETESSEDDLDKPDDNFQQVSRSNSEKQEETTKETHKKTTKRKANEKQSKTSKSRSKSTSKAKSKTADVEDENEFEDESRSRNDFDDENQNESNSESEEDERREKKKKGETKNEKKATKSKSTRKKLFSRRDKPSNMSALDAFGFS